MPSKGLRMAGTTTSSASWSGPLVGAARETPGSALKKDRAAAVGRGHASSFSAGRSAESLRSTARVGRIDRGRVGSIDSTDSEGRTRRRAVEVCLDIRRDLAPDRDAEVGTGEASVLEDRQRIAAVVGVRSVAGLVLRRGQAAGQ